LHEARPLLDYSRGDTSVMRQERVTTTDLRQRHPISRETRRKKNQLTSSFISVKRKMHLDTDQMREREKATVE
jgi:hypothetical protein